MDEDNNSSNKQFKRPVDPNLKAAKETYDAEGLINAQSPNKKSKIIRPSK